MGKPIQDFWGLCKKCLRKAIIPHSSEANYPNSTWNREENQTKYFKNQILILVFFLHLTLSWVRVERSLCVLLKRQKTWQMVEWRVNGESTRDPSLLYLFSCWFIFFLLKNFRFGSFANKIFPCALELFCKIFCWFESINLFIRVMKVGWNPVHIRSSAWLVIYYYTIRYRNGWTT